MEPRLNPHDSGPGTQGIHPPGFAFSKDRGIMMRRKSFMETLLQLKHRDLATGYLSKLTTKGRWQERWFVVHGHYLSYFRKHLETSQHVGLIPSPAGSINLWHVTQVTLDHNKVRVGCLSMDGQPRANNLLAYACVIESTSRKLFGSIHACRQLIENRNLAVLHKRTTMIAALEIVCLVSWGWQTA
jgi:hypothetical protein